jgi:O-antigen/teichoic acid export membrane protein
LRKENVRSLVLGGASTQAASVVMFLLDPLSKGVLALNLGPGSVAVYDLSMKVGWGLHSVMSAFSRLFLQIPSSEQSRRIVLLGQAANLTWVPTVLVGAICISVLPPLLSTWLRVEQAQLGLGMAIAVTTCSLMTAAAAGYISLLAFHDLAFIFRNQMILGFANVLGAPLLVPVVGLAGAFLGAFAGTVVNVMLISRRLKMHMLAFGGFGSLARPFRGRLMAAIAVFGVAWIAAVSPSLLTVSVAAFLGASALLLREPLARAAWQRVSGRLAE